MAGKSRLAMLKDRAEALHRARIVPPIVRWIQAQPTETLTRLRQIYETGGDLAAELERVRYDQNNTR